MIQLEIEFVEWRPIPGFSKYSASSDGRIPREVAGQGARAGWVLKPWWAGNNRGYRYVQIVDDFDKIRKARVCVLVCSAFQGRRPAGHECDHRDTDTANDTADNLRWLPDTINALLGSYKRWGRPVDDIEYAGVAREAGDPF